MVEKINSEMVKKIMSTDRFIVIYYNSFNWQWTIKECYLKAKSKNEHF